MHSDVDTLRRVELLSELRAGDFDVLVGINLLREGLDLPEVSLVAILDADKEGFLRSGTSLIQTIGRAARNLHGEVHMYADTITGSMREAIDETDRRRAVQQAYNEEHGIDPQPLVKRLSDITERLRREDEDTREILAEFDYGKGKRGFNATITDEQRAAFARSQSDDAPLAPPAEDLVELIASLTDQMHAAAADLQFELAARLRDELGDLKRELRQMKEAGHA